MGTLSAATSGRTGWFYSFLLANMTNGGTAPLIPLFLVVAFSGTLLQVGVITAATSVASIPAFIIWGNLSDHLHRRKLFIVEGFAGLFVSMAIMWMSVNFAMFFVANFLLGLLYSASAPAGTALLIEQTPKEQWVSHLGRFSRLGGAGYLLGLIAGALWFYVLPSTPFDMRTFFLFSTVVALSGAIVAFLLVDEKRAGTGNAGSRKENQWNAIAGVPLHITERAKYLPSRIGAVIRLATPSSQERSEISGRLWLYYLVTILFSTGFTAFYAVFPNYLADYLGRKFSIAESLIFLVYIGSSLGSTLTYSRVSYMSRSMGEKRLQSIAASVRVLLIPSFFFVPLLLHSSAEVVVSMVVLNSIMGFCWAIISVTGQSMVARMAGPHIKGEAIGLYNSSTGTGAIMGALMGGLVTQNFGYMSDFICSSVFVLSGISVLAAVRAAADAPSAAPSGKAKHRIVNWSRIFTK